MKFQMNVEKSMKQLEEKIQLLVGLDLREITHFQDGDVNAVVMFFGRTHNDGLMTGFSIALFGTWHILYKGKSVCAYVRGHDPNQTLRNNLKFIEHQVVKQVYFWREKLHLFLGFENGYWLALYHHVDEKGYVFFPPSDSLISSDPIRVQDGYVNETLLMT